MHYTVTCINKTAQNHQTWKWQIHQSRLAPKQWALYGLKTADLTCWSLYIHNSKTKCKRNSSVSDNCGNIRYHNSCKINTLATTVHHNQHRPTESYMSTLWTSGHLDASSAWTYMNFLFGRLSIRETDQQSSKAEEAFRVSSQGFM